MHGEWIVTPRKPDRLAWLEHWKGRVVLILAIAGAGVAVQQYASGYAKIDDLQVARGIAADRAMQLESRVVELDRRAAVVESTLASMQRTLDRIDRQLWEVGKATGAKPIGVQP